MKRRIVAILLMFSFLLGLSAPRIARMALRHLRGAAVATAVVATSAQRVHAVPFVSDTFTGTAGTTLTSHTGETGATWTKSSAFSTGEQVLSDANALRNNTGNTVFYGASGTPPDADYEEEAVVAVKSVIGTEALYLLARYDGAQDCYALLFYADQLQLIRFMAAGAGSGQIGASHMFTPTPGTDYTVRISCEGSTIKAWLNGVAVITATDANITAAGKAGVGAGGISGTNSTGFHIKSVVARELTVGPANPYADDATRVDLTLDGDPSIVFVPLDYDAADGAPLYVFLHGSGGSEESILDAGVQAAVTGLLQAGYIVGCPDAAGESWGNAASSQAVVTFVNTVSSTYNVRRTVMEGGSMGGLVLLNALKTGRLPSVTGAYLIEPVGDLSGVYTGAGGGTNFSTPINAAYAISGDYGAKTAGHDPLLMDPAVFSQWRRLPFRIVRSDEDTIIPAAVHSDPLAVLLRGRVRSVTIFEATGQHGDASCVNAADILSFADACPIPADRAEFGGNFLGF